MSFYWKNICKQKTAPESEKVDPALKFMLNIPLARESVRQAHTLFWREHQKNIKKLKKGVDR